MPLDDVTRQTKAFNIVFSPEAANLPVVYANAINVALGPSEFFITLGTVLPPVVKTAADLEGIDELVAQPLIRFAVSPQAMGQFIDVMRQQFDQMQQLVQAQSERTATSEVNKDE
jgi:hypothetical protein